MKIRVFIDQAKKKKGESSWCVELTLGNKRKRKYLPTREKAYAYKKELETPFLQGITEESAPEDIRLSVILKMHIDGLVARGARNHTIESRKTKCSSFIKRMNNPKLSSVSREAFRDYILKHGHTESHRKSIRSEVGTMLNWAFKHNHTTTNYYKISWDANFNDEKLIGILTPEEAEDLMNNISDAYKVAMALALFAGIRPMEIPRIKWKNIYPTKRLIIIEGSQAKTRRNRKLADLPENLFKWIKAYKDKCGYYLGGSSKYDHVPIQEYYNSGHSKKQTMEHFGISSTGTLDYLLKKKGHRKFKPFDGPANRYRPFADARQEACEKCGILYPHDCARHSFGTYGYFLPGGKPWAMRCMGHNNQTTYDQYYLNTGVGSEEAMDYFSVKPKKLKVETKLRPVIFIK
jgi:integrase